MTETKKGYPPLIKSDIKLTIGMLVSNHVEYIRNCMEALKPLLEAVPSELIIIDTKGEETDGSIAIAREYTDLIYRFEWCNDFSAARNFCLSHARGEWFLYQDDDEWFDDVQEFIDFFVSGECEKYYSGFYYTRDYSISGSYSMGIAGRMIRRTVNTKFVGKVHEGFNEVYAPNKLFSCFTHHMGYKFATEESRKQHQHRNLSILETELKECGYTPRICAQMAQELLYLDATARQGYDFAMKSLEKLLQQGQIEDSCSQWLLTATVRYFAMTENYKEMLVQVVKIKKKYVLLQMAELVIAAVIIREATKCSDFSVIVEYSDTYIKNWNWLKAHGEEALLQTQMDFPRYYSVEYYEEILRVRKIACLSEMNQLVAVAEEAFPVIKRILLSGGDSLEIISTLQEMVILYGNKAESYFGEDKERNLKLEQCCELLWETVNAKNKKEAVLLFDRAVDCFETGKL